jgi:hypothetical protein
MTNTKYLKYWQVYVLGVVSLAVIRMGRSSRANTVGRRLVGGLYETSLPAKSRHARLTTC